MAEEAQDGTGVEQTVPIQAMLDERRKAQEREAENERLRQEIAELKNGGDDLSRSALDEAVENGQITQAQADRLWEEHQLGSLTQGVSAKVTEQLRAEREQAEIQSELEAYVAKVPDLLVQGSERHRQVEAEAKFQSRLTGKPITDMVTQLAAARAVLGPVDRIVSPGKRPVETHQETGEDDGDETETGDSEGFPKSWGLDKRRSDHYRRLIDRGIYHDGSGQERG